MNKNEQIPASISKKETPEERDERISREVREIFIDEANRGIKNAMSLKKKKPSLDYYDNRREEKEDGSEVPYQGRYGKFNK